MNKPSKRRGATSKRLMNTSPNWCGKLWPRKKNGRTAVMKLWTKKRKHGKRYTTKLKEQYLGQYIALYQGQVVDVHADPLALNRRIRQNYPDQIVWVSQVREEPFREIYMR